MVEAGVGVVEAIVAAGVILHVRPVLVEVVANNVVEEAKTLKHQSKRHCQQIIMHQGMRRKARMKQAGVEVSAVEVDVGVVVILPVTVKGVVKTKLQKHRKIGHRHQIILEKKEMDEVGAMEVVVVVVVIRRGLPVLIVVDEAEETKQQKCPKIGHRHLRIPQVKKGGGGVEAIVVVVVAVAIPQGLPVLVKASGVGGGGKLEHQRIDSHHPRIHHIKRSNEVMVGAGVEALVVKVVVAVIRQDLRVLVMEIGVDKAGILKH